MAWALVACSSPPALQGMGGRCLQVSDCKLGLVCVPEPDGKTRACSSDLARIVNTEDAGATEAKAPAPASDGGQGPDAGAPASANDASDETGGGGIQDAPSQE